MESESAGWDSYSCIYNLYLVPEYLLYLLFFVSEYLYLL